MNKSSVEDRKFFENLKTKDSDSFKEFYTRYYKTVKGIALSILKNNFEADDIAQIVFMKIYNMNECLIPTKNEQSWLYNVTKNVCIDYIRKNKLNIYTDSIYEIESNDNTINKIIDNISYYKIIENLSTKEQEIVSLRIISELSFKEIGKLLNIPTSTVSWIYYKSMKSLKIIVNSLLMFLFMIIGYKLVEELTYKDKGIAIPINDINMIEETITRTNNIMNLKIIVIISIFTLLIVYLLFIFIKYHKNKIQSSSKK